MGLREATMKEQFWFLRSRIPSYLVKPVSYTHLQPPLVPVLNPQHAVLVFIESGHQNPLEARHQRFTLPGR